MQLSLRTLIQFNVFFESICNSTYRWSWRILQSRLPLVKGPRQESIQTIGYSVFKERGGADKLTPSLLSRVRERVENQIFYFAFIMLLSLSKTF